MTEPSVAATEAKACCAAAYSSDAVALVLGDSYHPGGLHLTRRLAELCDLGAGQHVLDVASGPGSSALLLAAEYGVRVDGVDLSEPSVKRAAAAAADAGLTDRAAFRVGDAERLPFDDDTFDVIVCFEVIEHIVGADRALSEFARVLTADGVLAISSPNRDTYMPGNPHHHHEYVPDELRAALSEGFAVVQLYRQHGWLASAVLDDARFAGEHDGEPLAVRKLGKQQPGEELYTVALASDRPIPDPPSLAVLTERLELRRWNELLIEQRETLERSQGELAELQGLFAEQQQVVERQEAELAELEALRVTIGDHERHIEALNQRIVALGHREADLRAQLHDAHREMKQRDDEIFRRRVEDLRVRDEEINWLRDVLEQRDEELAWLREVVAQREHALAESQYELATIQNTRVWRTGQRFWRLRARVTGRHRGSRR